MLMCWTGDVVSGVPWYVSIPCTVYPKKYAHGFVVLCFVVVMQSFIMNSYEVFIHIHQGCFAGTGAIVRLPQCQWSKPDWYWKISQCITTTKHSKAKTVCIFLGIYCTIRHIWVLGTLQPTRPMACHHPIPSGNMMTSSNGNIFRVTGPLIKSPVNSPHKCQWRGALMFSLICALNKRLSKQSWGWWFETPSRPLWRHCNESQFVCLMWCVIVFSITVILTKFSSLSAMEGTKVEQTVTKIWFRVVKTCLGVPELGWNQSDATIASDRLWSAAGTLWHVWRKAGQWNDNVDTAEKCWCAREA